MFNAESRFVEHFGIEPDTIAIIECLQLAVMAKDVPTFFSNIWRAKLAFSATRAAMHEDFAAVFTAYCETSKLLMTALSDEYGKVLGKKSVRAESG